MTDHTDPTTGMPLCDCEEVATYEWHAIRRTVYFCNDCLAWTSPEIRAKAAKIHTSL